MTDYTRPFSELRAADEPLFGGKSAGLGELLAAGVPVPPGFGVSTAAFERFVEEAGLGGQIEAALADVAGGELEALERAARTIGGAIRRAPVPADVRAEVERRYRELSGAQAGSSRRTESAASGAGGVQPAVAVRSSAIGEDTAEATFAGQQESYLWVRGPEHVCAALRDCWASLYSAPAISYRLRLAEGGPQPAMGVAVQVMVDAAVAGVMFTCSPLSGDPSVVAINASWGLGLAVVGGEVTPDEYLVSKVTRELVRERLGNKTVEYVPSPEGHGTARVPVAPERAALRCLSEDQLAALVEIARRVERYFGCHQDIEWALARDGSLWFVQSRPVTVAARRSRPVVAESALSLVMRKFGVNVD
jgi:pyruvate,water dikinase